MTILRTLAATALATSVSSCLTTAVVSADRPPGDERAALRKMIKDGNFKDAHGGFRSLALDANSNPRLVGQYLTQAVHCLKRLNRTAETDDLREAVLRAHSANWRLLAAAAQSYLSAEHYGHVIAGTFQRGRHRGGGKAVGCLDRDRVRALQLFEQAMPHAAADPDRGQVAEFYLSLAGALLANRGYRQAWRLQYLSDLQHLPDYQPGWRSDHGRTQGAPVGDDGTPIYHRTPPTWKAAESDGQRWRFALNQAIETSPRCLNRVRYQWADFLHHQFGVQTMADHHRFFSRPVAHESGPDQSGTYALQTLGDDETIARLATGIRRFALPDEMNFIKVLEQIIDDDKTGYGKQAITKLAHIFQDRRQYPRAASAWRKNIEKYGSEKNKRRQLEQIEGNWGRFEPIMTQPAHTGATVQFRFRNGHKVLFTAQRIRVAQLLADVKNYVKSNPKKLDRNKLNLGRLGHRLITQNQTQYIGQQVAQWELPLKPRENHFDQRITVTTPLSQAGAYLLTAKMTDGNTSKIVIWVSDTAIVRKPMAGKVLYYVADAVTGKPIPGAKVEWFGYWQENLGRNRYQVHTQNFAERTGADGQVVLPVDDNNRRYQWMVTATTPGGRLAYLGFTNVWQVGYHDPTYDQVKVFTITDRPVYRPDQAVHFKFWVRHARYDIEETSRFANQTFQVEVHDPKGEKTLSEAMTTDQFGGIAGSYQLPADAKLGVYRLQVVGRGGGLFRVEEYKKPEFEVSVEAPTVPVVLGEKVTATVKARYYFGAPVTQAKVRIKVLRTTPTETWYPGGRWDWLYGRGYWWFAYDYSWYPGWREWGCRRPAPWWWGHRPASPEVVVQQETEIRPDGTVLVEIDTSLAKQIHPDQDHRYQITAEVVDQSRRTIVGTGAVLVARKPLKVFTWLDRGYYRVGDVVRANFAARTLDQKPVSGTGKVALLQITYKDGDKPVETPVRTWDLDTDAQGSAQLRLKASAKGQYRLDFQLTDANGHVSRSGYVFTIVGEGFDGSQFRFNDLELIPDKRQYAPGETVKLQVNTNRMGAAVLLFLRPAGGVYLPPRIVRLTGKSTIVDLLVAKKDMPNFFIEAVTVAQGKVFDVVREIHVPPVQRILGVEVVASSPAYRPGQKARVKVRLTDQQGKPFVGSSVLAVYDKAVEYISGGTNVPDIKAFFWKWRRHHRPRCESNLDRSHDNMTLPGKPGMEHLGIFGRNVTEELGKQKTVRGSRADYSLTVGMARSLRAPADSESVALDASAAAVPLEVAGIDAEADGKKDGGGATALVQPEIRARFADTALWEASLTTDQEGVTEVELDMPDSLTTWKVKAWAMGAGTRVGQGETEIITRKDLIVRMQAPRFFVETDRVVLSANVHNYLDHDKQVQVVLELDGETLKPDGNLARTVEVPAAGEARVDWSVTAVREGQATLRMQALTDEESDAVEMHFPVYVHGMLKMEAFSGVLRPRAQRGHFSVQVPDRRRPADSRLEVRFSPTLAAAMVDALPYLANYPYGCTEQTLNRFLPTVVTQKILLDMGLDLAAIADKRTNLNAQELGDDQARARGWQRYASNPVFDDAEVRRMVKQGVRALTEMQLPDGGWGWFSGWGERSYPHTTAVVVHGLQIAVQNDVALLPGVLEGGIAWLTAYQAEQVRRLNNAATKTKPYKRNADNLDALVYTVLVDAGVENQAMMDYLYRDRNALAVYSKAMFGIALHRQAAKDKLAMILRNIGQYVVQDDENQTAYLNLPEDSWWYWYGSEYEAHAYYLKLLAATEPKGEMASRLVKYLLGNRKHATHWNSTRDTAIVIEAMADYLRASGEDQPDLTVQVWLDGKKRKEVKITPQNLFTFDNKFVLEGKEVETGVHTVELRRQGNGPLYYNGYLTTFTLEPYISKAGLELKVNRKVFKLIEVAATVKAAGSRGQIVEQAVEKYERVELPNLAAVQSGDLVEIELTIESKNDYEYVIFEDMKAAGFEAVALRSGYTGNALGAYMEFRDNRVVLFVRRLARGRHSVSYRMRAEIPGHFSALPTQAYAMYAPELKGNSDEIKLQVDDVPAEPTAVDD